MKVKRESPELYEKVRKGDISASTAYGIVVSDKPVEKKSAKKPTKTEDGRRICTVCGEPIDDGDYYESRPSMHKACWNKRRSESQYAYPDKSLLDNVPAYTIGSLLTELTSGADSLKDAWGESISINESMGVILTRTQKKRLDRAVSNLFKTIQKIKEEISNG